MASRIVVDSFYDRAADLRAQFDERQGDVRSTRRDRFVWDYWHVPGQYTLLRTPAWEYFAKPAYERFHRALVAWGRRTLGCHDISPPWLSLYVDGCEQQLHGDLPHGPFAFVFSLSRGPFRGGETMILRDETLDYWRDFASVRSVEEPQLVHAIAPRFNRLVCFDPKLPHGVRRVDGPRDPREGRLVIHGWFVAPRPFITGALRAAQVSARLGDVDELLARSTLALAGVLTFHIAVSEAGRVSRVTILSDTTRVPSHEEAVRRALVNQLRALMRRWVFGKGRGERSITLPLVFERG